MTNILVVTGSVRPGSVNSNVVPVVVELLQERGASVTIADLGELSLPFFNEAIIPSDPAFAPTDEGVVRWAGMVAAADGVVLVTPEYNHTMSPVQLNAVDWLFREWRDKPVALVGYGWRGAVQAHATAREALAVNLKARVGDNQTSLFFTKDLNLDGSILDQAAVYGKIGATLDELLEAVA